MTYLFTNTQEFQKKNDCGQMYRNNEIYMETKKEKNHRHLKLRYLKLPCPQS